MRHEGQIMLNSMTSTSNIDYNSIRILDCVRGILQYLQALKLRELNPSVVLSYYKTGHSILSDISDVKEKNKKNERKSIC